MSNVHFSLQQNDKSRGLRICTDHHFFLINQNLEITDSIEIPSRLIVFSSYHFTPSFLH